VLTAINGELGVSMVRGHRDELALVILDLAMPVMGGAEAFAQIRALVPDLPVMLTSGYDATEAMGKLGNESPAGFIQKPASVEDMLETVKRILRK
jgi:DNA-binding NarL/FixJ family response regulator